MLAVSPNFTNCITNKSAAKSSMVSTITKKKKEIDLPNIPALGQLISVFAPGARL